MLDDEHSKYSGRRGAHCSHPLWLDRLQYPPEEEEPRSSVLTLFDIEPVLEPLPSEVEAFLADADARIDDFFDRRRNNRRVDFYPSDYPLVYSVLRALRQRNDQARRFCEWGSGFGVVAGLGALLGYEAYGIEINPWLVAASKDLHAKHNLELKILEGSFIPEEYARNETFSNGETNTILSGSGVYDGVDVDIEDFDVIFAFPWPDEEEMYRDLFARYADNGAVLITYHSIEQIRAYYKTVAPIANG